MHPNGAMNTQGAAIWTPLPIKLTNACTNYDAIRARDATGMEPVERTGLSLFESFPFRSQGRHGKQTARRHCSLPAARLPLAGSMCQLRAFYHP